SYVATNDTGLAGQVIVTDDCLLVASSSKTYIFDLVSQQLVQTLPYGGSISLADGNLCFFDIFSGSVAWNTQLPSDKIEHRQKILRRAIAPRLAFGRGEQTVQSFQKCRC